MKQGYRRHNGAPERLGYSQHDSAPGRAYLEGPLPTADTLGGCASPKAGRCIMGAPRLPHATRQCG